MNLSPPESSSESSIGVFSLLKIVRLSDRAGSLYLKPLALQNKERNSRKQWNQVIAKA